MRPLPAPQGHNIQVLARFSADLQKHVLFRN
jgi:hypothetical protein